MNRGSYEWVPDYYASTSGDDFGVMQSYDGAVIDYGRPRNALPAERGGYAAGTEIYGRGLRSANRGPLLKNGEFISAANAVANNLDYPFLSMLMRETSTALSSLPTPDENDGIGFSSFEVWAGANPYYLFTVDDIATTNGRISSITIEYAVYTSEEWETAVLNTTGKDKPPELSLAGTTPVAIVALFDEDSVGTWLDLTRPTNETGGRWGPVSDQVVTGAAVSEAASILGGQLTAVSIPPWSYENDTKVSIDELNVTHPGQYKSPSDASKQTWITAGKRIVSINMTGRYFSSSDYYPRLRAIMIMPNTRKGASTVTLNGAQTHWNCTVNGIRVYDAVQTNAVPGHIETDSQGNSIVVKPQTPCMVFGYSWRISHSVQMSKYTSPIQPSIGTLLSDNPGNARRRGTFKFKLYHPDVPGLGVAHSVRFYYGLAVLPVPGMSPIWGTFSLIGTLSAMSSDMDLLLVQYIGPLPGNQSLTFIPGNSQNSESELGKVAYGGQFAYSRQTVGLRCAAKDLAGVNPPTKPDGPSSIWRILEGSDLPAGFDNGVFPIWYDLEANSATWFSFLSMNAVGVQKFNADAPASYIGGYTPAVRGGPMTNVPGIGSFGMSPSANTGFSGTDKVTVYSKPKCLSAGSLINISDFCSESNMKSHLATFVSNGASIGGAFNIFSGNWRVRFAADLDNGDLDNVQVFFRFAFVNSELSDDEMNGSRLWSHTDQVIEFHFRPSSKPNEGGLLIASGPPTAATLISTPPLVAESLAYDLSWFCPNAIDGDPYLSLGGAEAAEDGEEETLPSQSQVSSIDRVINAQLPWESTKVVMQAWAVAYSRPGVRIRNPESEKSYPVVKFSWGGETDAAFQTMITEAKSGAILAQQDPVVEQYDTVKKIIVTAIDQGENPAASSNAGSFRDKPLFNTALVLGINRFTPGVDNTDLPELAILTNDDDDVAGITIEGVVPKGHYDPLDEAAQIADTFVNLVSDSEEQIDAIIGGTTIKPQVINISGQMFFNNSMFDAKVIISLYIVDTDTDVGYLVGSSGSIYGVSSALGPSQEPVTNINARIVIGQAITVPELRARLMLRFKVWAYENSNSEREIAEIATENFNSSYRSIDFANLKLECSEGIELVSNETYLLGSNNWYQNLPVTSGRTFGSADYYFVADEDSTRSTVMVPATMSNYGYWYLYGWIFSPFWYLDMPYGSVFEIQDRAGLTHGSPVTGTNVGTTERAQQSVRIRTAVDTLPSLGISADRGGRTFGGRGFIARASGENSSEELGGDALGIIPIQDHRFVKSLVEHIVRAGEQVIIGKNPLIVAIDPDSEWLKHLRIFYGFARPEARFLFYEQDDFDAASYQSSIAMMANYDGSCTRWQNPYGEPGSGGDSQVIVTNDMKMLGAAVDPFSFTLYLVGYRPSDPDSPQNGGMIVMRSIRPLLVFGTVSASTSPLHFVDGIIGENDYNTSSVNQPMVPPRLDSDNSRSNQLGPNGEPIAAAESFPDIFVDNASILYVFYSLMSNSEVDVPSNTKGVRGKVFCRRSMNIGYYFEPPFEVADIGYRAAISYSNQIAGLIDDESFDVKHIVSLYSDVHKMYVLFFWAGGKIFMRLMQHPGIMADRVSSSQNRADFHSGNQIYMVAGSTDFADGREGSGLDKWLKMHWDSALQTETTEYGEWGDYVDGENWKQNNYGEINSNSDYGQLHHPSILICRYNNDPDVPAQRVAAYLVGSTAEPEMVLTFLDEQLRLMYKRIRLSGKHPLITPALYLSTNVI